MLESENNSSFPGESVLSGEGWVLVLEPFGLCKHSDHKLVCLLSGRRHGAPCTKGRSRGPDDEAPPFPTSPDWGVGGVGKPFQPDERGNESN